MVVIQYWNIQPKNDDFLHYDFLISGKKTQAKGMEITLKVLKMHGPFVDDVAVRWGRDFCKSESSRKIKMQRVCMHISFKMIVATIMPIHFHGQSSVQSIWHGVLAHFFRNLKRQFNFDP